MVDPQKLLEALDNVNELSKDVDFGTLANLSLYMLIVTAQVIETAPPAVQLQLKQSITAMVDDSTAQVSAFDNEAAWRLLDHLGLSFAPDRNAYVTHLRQVMN